MKKKLNFTHHALAIIVAGVTLLGFDLATASAQCPNQRRPVFQQPIYNFQPVQRFRPVQGINPQPVYIAPVQSVQPAIYYPSTQYSRATPQPVTLSPMEKARQHTKTAKEQFLTASYPSAIKELNEVVKIAPKDSSAYQFRSLAAFAQRRFGDAAADAYDAMSYGNAWTMPVIQSLYGSNDKLYAAHLQELEREAMNDNASMQTHFLLAYHLLVDEQWDAAKIQLQKVLQLSPEEPLSTKLLAAVEQKLRG